MPVLQLLQSFNAGELSPMLDVRTSLEKYGSGCLTLQNFIILPYGGVMRRPGTEYMGEAKFPSSQCRVIGFNFSDTTSFVIELGEQYARFWSNGEQVRKDSADDWATSTAYSVGDYVDYEGTLYYCTSPHTSDASDFANDSARWTEQSILEVPTPYTAGALRTIQYTQVNDVMFLVHPDYPVQKLSRVSDVEWTLEEWAPEWPAFLDENDTTTTLAVDTAALGTGRTLTASTDTFEQSIHVGSYWLVGHAVENAVVELDLSVTGTSSSTLKVFGAWELTTFGTWKGTLNLQRSYDGTTWETIRTFGADADRNVSATGTENKECSLRLKFTENASTGGKAYLERAEAREYGIFYVTGVTSPTVATGTVVKAFKSTDATAIWAEGAFSRKRGFPRTVALHDQRLIFGGTYYRPLTVWGSAVDDFVNFRYSTKADSAFSFTLSSNESNPINWIVSQSELLVGTSGDEWTLGPADDAQVLGPSNVRARRQSSYGSTFFQARVVNEVALFVQRQGRKVRELTYAFEKDGWVAPDLTILAEHISKGGITEGAFQQQPDSIFWAVTGDGNLIGMTYERDQNVVGWHRHTTQGTFESVATIYSGSQADEVWFVVRREIAGVEHRFIERFRPGWREAMEAEEKTNWWYVDCAARSESPTDTTTFPGWTHLAGAEVQICSDGASNPDRTVASDGTITLQNASRIVVAGLSFDSVLRPMRLHMDMRNGTSHGRKTKVFRMVGKFYKSLGGEYSTDGQEYFPVYTRTPEDPMDASPPVFTGDKEFHMGGGYSDTADVYIRQQQPFPLTVLALIPKWDVFGD